jgi:hypothetical protein
MSLKRGGKCFSGQWPLSPPYLSLVFSPPRPADLNLFAFLAEREGFEPPIPVKVCLISSQVHSTALPSLRSFIINGLGCPVKAGGRFRDAARMLSESHPPLNGIGLLAGIALMTTECNCIVCLRIVSTAGDDSGNCWSAGLRTIPRAGMRPVEHIPG